MQRKAIITHYSAVDKRTDMTFVKYKNGAKYAIFDNPLD
jgi:hypothetical protein